MSRPLLGLAVVAAGLPCVLGRPAAEPAGPRLLLAFASVRERRAPPYPKIYFYEHDGVENGKPAGSVDAVEKGANMVRSDMHPSLSRDGRFCAFSAQIGVINGARVEIWDRKERKLLPAAAFNDSPDVHRMGPSLSGDGRLVAFSAWAQPGGSPRWGVYVADRAGNRLLDLPRLNGEAIDQRMPALSGDGRFLAYASNARGGVGLTDVCLYDLIEKKAVGLAEMNSKAADVQPCLGGDGRLIAFTSDRPGGMGGRDLYLYDRMEKKFLPLPGLNTEAHEQSPALSADGRYLAFVSERLGGAGERDVYLYDRERQKLLPTPGLNSREDDYDPCVVVLAQK
jgi:Tol biopolymer transport system component